MKIFCISDFHLMGVNPKSRKDNILEVQMNKLEFIFQKVKKEKGILISAGDFFHTPRNWFLLPVIIELLRKYQVDFYAVFGQHDTYMYSEITRYSTNLGIIEKAGLVKILCAVPEIIDNENLELYGSSWSAFIPTTLNNNAFKVLSIHSPITVKPLFPGHKIITGKDFLNSYRDYDLILCGDIHRKFIYEKSGRIIVNTGCIIRYEATKYNFEYQPELFFYDTVSGEYDFLPIPCEKADMILDREHLEKSAELNMVMNKFVKGLNWKEVEKVDFFQNLSNFLSQNKVDKEVKDIISKKIGDFKNV